MEYNIFDLWYVLRQVILLMYGSIYYFKNLCITHNNVIDIYIMGILLKEYHSGVDVTKKKTWDKPTTAY